MIALSPSRTTGLAAANARLLVRNRLTLVYAVLLPLFPMALLFTVPRGEVGVGAGVISSVLLLAWLFPVYYNVLSQVVTRRDELVLKRLRTGESRDLEILVSIALPGVAVAAGVSVLSVGVGLALGLPMLVNPLLYAVVVLGGGVLFSAFAIWTAAWTRNAEAAQMTSLPILLLAMLGSFRAAFPESIRPFVDATPGAALDRLVRIGWFGQGPDGDVGFASSWGAAAQPVAVLLGWTALAVWLAQRSMRWEPRT